MRAPVAGAGRGRHPDMPRRPNCLLGVPANELGGIPRLACRIRARLAVLQRDQACNVVEPLHEKIVSATKHFASFARTSGTPVGKGGFGGIKTSHGVFDGS